LTELVCRGRRDSADRADLTGGPIDLIRRAPSLSPQLLSGAWSAAHLVNTILTRARAARKPSIRDVIVDALKEQAGGRVTASMWRHIEQVVASLRAPTDRTAAGLIRDHRGIGAAAQWGGAETYMALGHSVLSAIREGIEQPVAALVGAWNPAWAADWLPTKGTDTVAVAVGAVTRNARRSLIGWQHDAASLACSSFIAEVCEKREFASAESGFARLARAAGWVLADTGTCWATERHCTLRRDPQGRLHSETGAAVTYPDGWTLHFWHGVRVPWEWIEHRDRLDPTTAFDWPNVEERRALVDIVGGWHRVLQRVNARIVDEDLDPAIGTLLECRPRADRPPQRFLRVQCGTGRTFALPVPPGCASAREANAWTYGLRGDELRLEART
jgi:hypothetical protein